LTRAKANIAGNFSRRTDSAASMQSNLAVDVSPARSRVEALYGAFARGDLQTVLETLDENVEWVNPGPEGIPCFGTHRGRDAVARNFFGFIGEQLEMRRFEPKSFLEDGNTVVVLLEQEATARRTGRSFTQSCAHVFTFRDGRVVRFQDFQNTHAVVAALQGT
jgi:uncharacterized protein